MKIALISFTDRGAALSEKIAAGLDNECERYSSRAVLGAKRFTMPLTKRLFNEYDALVFVSACAIAIRAVAPYIASKTTDPAVIAADDAGNFCVPLLSGHLGGANALAKKIARITGAAAVITTATDARGCFSPDMFAKANNLHITEMSAAKEIAAALLNGEKTGFLSDYPFINMPGEFFGENCRTGIFISGKTDISPFKTTLHLVPKNIVAGVGCKRLTDPKKFDTFVNETLLKNNIPLYRVRELRTIDLKKDEKAISDFCEKNKIPLRLYSASELAAVAGNFSGSEFVSAVTGVDNVCERAAAAEGGRIIAAKTARCGMTLAAAEESVTIDFKKEFTV